MNLFDGGAGNLGSVKGLSQKACDKGPSVVENLVRDATVSWGRTSRVHNGLREKIPCGCLDVIEARTFREVRIEDGVATFRSGGSGGPDRFPATPQDVVHFSGVCT